MTAVDWDEVKRLAADFQRAQLTSTSQVLSERNWVEIVSKLIESNLLEVIFTTDGREYITPQYLLKEIKDELDYNGGRINLVELAKSLNVDLSHITARISEIEKSSGCTIIMGQLINKTYQKTISEEINDKLQQAGQITIADLTKIYDLPGDFLLMVVERNLGKIIKAKQDKSDNQVFFTVAFIDKIKAIVRGALRALTRPTQVFTILEGTDLQERDFYYAYDCLVTEDKLTFGSITAKQGNATFIPQMYTKQQSEWVQNFYKQNGYLEYDALSRLGISDPTSFVKRNYSGLLDLSTCAVGPQILDQIEAAVEEALASSSFVDLMMVVPSVFGPDDVNKVLEIVLKRSKGKSVPLIFSDTFLVSEGFIQEVLKPFSDKGIVQNKAQQAINDGSYIQLKIDKKLGRPSGKEKIQENIETKFDKKEERRRKAGGGKSGGGTQGRETKTKSAPKKKGRARKESGSESDGGDRKLDLFTIDEVESEFIGNKSLQDLEDAGVLQDLAEHILPILNKITFDMTTRLFEETLVSVASQRRKAHMDLETQLENWILELRLSEKSIKLFPSADTQGRLTLSVLRFIGTEIVNHIFSYATSAEGGSPADPKQMTAEMRMRLLSLVDGDVSEALATLHKSLSGNSLEEFLATTDKALTLTGLLGRKPDKKKEKQFIQRRRETLLADLSAETAPAVALQLVTLNLFQAATGNVLQVSGKFVPTILAFLQPYLQAEDYSTLQAYQDKILKLLTVDSEEMEVELKSELNEELIKIKVIATNYKKTSSVKEH